MLMILVARAPGADRRQRRRHRRAGRVRGDGTVPRVLRLLPPGRHGAGRGAGRESRNALIRPSLASTARDKPCRPHREHPGDVCAPACAAAAQVYCGSLRWARVWGSQGPELKRRRRDRVIQLRRWVRVQLARFGATRGTGAALLVLVIGIAGCGSSSKKTGTAASAQPGATSTTLALSISETGKTAKYAGQPRSKAVS